MSNALATFQQASARITGRGMVFGAIVGATIALFADFGTGHQMLSTFVGTLLGGGLGFAAAMANPIPHNPPTTTTTSHT